MNNSNRNEHKVDNIISNISDKESAADFLQKHKIVNVETIFDISEYDLDSDRKGLILNIKEKIAIDICKVIIDVKFGKPSFEQMHDVIYNIGADCDKRVLVFTDSTNSRDYEKMGADLEIVRNLLLAINSKSLGLYLVKLAVTREYELFINELIYDPHDDPKDFAAPLPSQMEFLEEVFWQLYYIPLEKILLIEWKPFGDGFFNRNGIGSRRDLVHVEVMLKWSDSGLFFHVVENERSPGGLKNIWNNKSQILKRIFNGCKMKFNVKSEKRSELVIKVWDLPIDYLVGANRYEKEFCAKFMKASFSKLIMFFKYGIPDY
jgi:hypothetical protein